MSILYKVAIVGRTNVGKSTLFNKLIAEYKALVSPRAGTTRDRNYALCAWRDLDFYLIDTGGLLEADAEINKKIEAQALRARAEADLILFLVDTKVGLLPTDKQLAKQLKKEGQPLILVANKTDNNKLRANAAEFYKLNLGEPWSVSATNGMGTGDLLDEIVIKLKSLPKKEVKKNKSTARAIRVAIIGQPNVGKSSLLNALVDEERVITHHLPHTTRDAQEVEFTFNKQKIIFIDTAGMRRRSQHSRDSLEKQSIDQGLDSLKNSDVAILVTDVTKRLNWQDKHLIEEVRKTGNGLIILANKWDLVPDKNVETIKDYEKYYHGWLPFVDWAPLLFTSATEKTRIVKLFEVILAVYQEKNKIITENALSKLLKQIVKRHKPSRGKGIKHPYIYSLKQIRSNPPVFAIKIKYKSDLHDSYLRFMEKNLRYKFGFEGVPLSIKVLKTENVQDQN
jgi:GTP-binding protein